jgi:hypothetical protein
MNARNVNRKKAENRQVAVGSCCRTESRAHRAARPLPSAQTSPGVRPSAPCRRAREVTSPNSRRGRRAGQAGVCWARRHGRRGVAGQLPVSERRRVSALTASIEISPDPLMRSRSARPSVRPRPAEPWPGRRTGSSSAGAAKPRPVANTRARADSFGATSTTCSPSALGRVARCRPMRGAGRCPDSVRPLLDALDHRRTAVAVGAEAAGAQDGLVAGHHLDGGGALSRRPALLRPNESHAKVGNRGRDSPSV